MKYHSLMPIGISWIDLRTVFGPDRQEAQFWVGVCHLTDKVYMWTPLDYEKPLMVVTIEASPSEGYCEVGKECINFDCPLNRFEKEKFLSKFKDVGAESLGLPQSFGNKPLWFNAVDSEWHGFWAKLLYASDLKPEGGKLEFSQKMWDGYEERK